MEEPGSEEEIEAGRPEYVCRRVVRGPVLADWDGPGWEKCGLGRLREVVRGGKPNLGTEFRVGRDSKALRVLFRVEDDAPWATLTKRGDPLYTEEVVEVFLDPVGDGEMYFELEVNLKNAVLECCARRVRSGYRKDFRWRCEGLQTAVRLIPGGWAAELAIPFESVASREPESGDVWRANFTRIDRPEGRCRELSAWSPTGLAQFHVPQRFGGLRMEG